jgi:hypothetical protein
MTALDDGEFKRMWRVVDMSLSGHAVLRDRYRRREGLLTLIVVGLSIIATAFAFLSGETMIQVWQWRFSLATGLGILTSMIFFFALTDLVLDWKRLAWSHEDAVERLTRLKSRLRAVKVSGISSLSATDAVNLRTLYEQTVADVIEIPENQFLPLKAMHYRKVAISRLIDTHPGAPLLYLRFLAMVEGIRKREKSGEPDPKPDEPIEAPPT